MNRNVFWTFAAVSIYWLGWYAIGTEPSRNIVAWLGIAVAFANVMRYLPNAWAKYHTGASAGEWRMLMGLELFWLGFGAREIYLMGDRFGKWDAENNPLNGFFAFWILCAGLLCFYAARDPLPVAPYQNAWIVGAIAIIMFLSGMIAYRMVWG